MLCCMQMFSACSLPAIALHVECSDSVREISKLAVEVLGWHAAPEALLETCHFPNCMLNTWWHVRRWRDCMPNRVCMLLDWRVVIGLNPEWAPICSVPAYAASTQLPCIWSRQGWQASCQAKGHWVRLWKLEDQTLLCTITQLTHDISFVPL